MKLIAHRGCTKGPNVELENSPDFIMQAVKKGYDVEVDIWYADGKFWSGHDRPQYPLSSYLLRHSKIWRHAKNLQALRKLLDMGLHCFWHENDERTLTSQGYVWTYPEKEYDARSIIVVRGPLTGELPHVFGICSDYVEFIERPRPSGLVRD